MPRINREDVVFFEIFAPFFDTILNAKNMLKFSFNGAFKIAFLNSLYF